MSQRRWPSLRDLLVPACITLAVTLLRLGGELLAWPQLLFGTAAGGGLSIVGIGWLVPVFGVVFARRIAVASAPRPSGWLRVGIGIAVTVAGASVAALAMGRTPLAMAVGGTSVATGAAIAGSGWPQLARWLLAYAVLARLPIVAITAVTIAGDFGTHYEKLADGATAMAPLPRFLVLVLAQALFWLSATVLFGTLAGLADTARRHRRAR